MFRIPKVVLQFVITNIYPHILKLFIRVSNSYFLCADIFMANAMIADIKLYAVNLAIR